jgi:hypothetical protein
MGYNDAGENVTRSLPYLAYSERIIWKSGMFGSVLHKLIVYLANSGRFSSHQRRGMRRDSQMRDTLSSPVVQIYFQGKDTTGR